MDNEKILKLAEFINNSKKTVFFGGAGVSTESGVKDYRSEDGLYNTVREYGVSPETILSHSFFVSSPISFTTSITNIFLSLMLSRTRRILYLPRWRRKASFPRSSLRTLTDCIRRKQKRNRASRHNRRPLLYELRQTFPPR